MGGQGQCSASQCNPSQCTCCPSQCRCTSSQTSPSFVVTKQLPAASESKLGVTFGQNQSNAGNTLLEQPVSRMAEVGAATVKAMRGKERSDEVLRWQWASAATGLSLALEKGAKPSGADVGEK